MGGDGRGTQRVELRLGIVDASTSVPGPSSTLRHPPGPHPGSGIGGGLELRGVGWCDEAGVVPGVDSGGRVELNVSVDDCMSESVSIGDRCRTCSADVVSRCGFHR